MRRQRWGKGTPERAREGKKKGNIGLGEFQEMEEVLREEKVERSKVRIGVKEGQ